MTQRGEHALAQGALDPKALGGDARPIFELLAAEARTWPAL